MFGQLSAEVTSATTNRLMEARLTVQPSFHKIGYSQPIKLGSVVDPPRKMYIGRRKPSPDQSALEVALNNLDKCLDKCREPPQGALEAYETFAQPLVQDYGQLLEAFGPSFALAKKLSSHSPLQPSSHSPLPPLTETENASIEDAPEFKPSESARPAFLASLSHASPSSSSSAPRKMPGTFQPANPPY
ncbi:uncharacterized protein PGTG_19730 [Puccinia graminis f. sp. tritici CRL 75-36-700-3]|uniref:Uncharacterized protein n=1 Tax=Puccinia graminis f. sp. tritici (strain CRL 75-36-700-3 / race SCCL) TaxID=418459 RepID=E3LB21_PUCGT|nr:uncharacterized protein PGTG_19730 [Puccinia graminis f. sp. tritici CRL 75-36-700-3]EFP93746.1 hypothetical protein PGTG_19730 [Puccinia graminis f. sp. tritici CRL 75-36-700-3]